MEFLVAVIIGAFFGSLSGVSAMVWYMHREDEKRKAAYAEKRAMAREKEREEWRELMPYIEEALSEHVERAERLSERIRRLEREDEEQEGTHLALLEYQEQLSRTHRYIEDLKNMRERAKARME
jgi:hypothetical protein